MNIRRKKFVDFYLGSALIFSLRPLVTVLGRLLGRNHSPEVRGEIAVLKFLGGGSLVIAFPALLGIKRRYPDSKLVLVTTPGVRPFAELLGIFDRIEIIDDANPLTLLVTAFRSWARCIWVDTLIDLEVYSKLSTVFSLFTLARNRIGFYMEDIFWRKHICTHLIYFHRFSGAYLFYDLVAHLLGATVASVEQCRSHLATMLASARTPSEMPTICIGFACSDFGKERMLTAAQWVVISQRRLTPEKKARIDLLGGPYDVKAGDEIMGELKRHFPACEINNAAGTLTLEESVRRLWNAEEYWGIDSGLLHFARLGGVRTTSIWGPTDPQTRLRPITALSETVIYERIPCSPCIHVSDTPPCDGNNKCIQRLFDPTIAVDGADLLFTAWPHAGKHKAAE